MTHPPLYVMPNPETQGLVLRWMPASLAPYSAELTKYLTSKFEGQAIDEDLLYSVNWYAHQWITRAYDDKVLFRLRKGEDCCGLCDGD